MPSAGYKLPYNACFSGFFFALQANPRVPCTMSRKGKRSLEFSQEEVINPIRPLLGRQKRNCTGRKTLVLDLDETLIHSSFKPIRAYDFVVYVTIEEAGCESSSSSSSNSMPKAVYVLKRPGVDRFLQAMARKYELVVFTAGVKSYADPLLDYLDPFKTLFSYRLYRDSCTLYPSVGSNGQPAFVKDLSLLGRELSKVVIVDNSPQSYLLQPENAVPISSFVDDPCDQQLAHLTPFLSLLAHLPINVADILRNNSATI